MENEDSLVKRKLMDAIDEVVKGTGFAPPEGGILVDFLVVMVHMDNEGETGASWMNFGSMEAAEGMAHKVVRGVRALDYAKMRYAIGEDE